MIFGDFQSLCLSAVLLSTASALPPHQLQRQVR